MGSKLCIIVNADDRTQIVDRLQALYPADTEVYSINFESGFSQLISSDTTEILFSGGGAQTLKANPELRDEAYAFITASALPMLGVCFGAQLLARALGARIVKLPTSSKGNCVMRIVHHKDAFAGKYLTQVYKNQVWSLQQLPEELQILGCSSDGIDMFMHRQRPVAGVQFHPEQFTAASDGKQIFQQLRALVLAQN